jgi:hypothetical protein
MSLIHSSYYQPRVIAFNGNVTPTQLDRVQDLTAAVTLNREKIKEIGRDGTVAWLKRIPAVRVTMRQLEYGNLALWQQLANSSTLGNDGQTAINIATAYKTSMVDLCGYKTDDDGTFIGTVWYPKLRVAGWGLNIGDPQAVVERTVDLMGEDETLLENNNKYLIYKTFTATGGSNETFSCSNPTPAGDPDSSGRYLFTVVRYRPSTGVTTELTYTTDYTYAPNTLTVVTTTVGDIIKVWYSAVSYISGQSLFTNNNTDAGTLEAKMVSIELDTNQYCYRLQSVGIDVTYDRSDVYEIGSENVVSRGARDKTVRITLGRIVDDLSMERALRGVGSTYGRIDARDMLDNITLKVKMYSSAAKTTFKFGYKFTNLTPVGIDAGTPLNDYITRGVTLEGEEGIISADADFFATA